MRLFNLLQLIVSALAPGATTAPGTLENSNQSYGTGAMQFSSAFGYPIAWNGTEWTAAAPCPPAGGGQGTVLVKASSADYDFAWSAQPPTLTLAGLSDVDEPTAPANGQVLTYIAAESKWAARTPAAGGGGSGGATTLAQLTDVDELTAPPTDGQVLTYIGSESEWAPRTLPTGLPAVTSADNGDTLAVVNGAWAKFVSPFQGPILASWSTPIN